jgi:acetylglutamate kinase
MVEGRRITDAATLEIVTMVYAGLINKGIVAKLQALECNAMGVTGADANLIPSTRRSKGAVDYGFVGDPAVERIHAGNLTVLLESGFIPVFAPITHDGKGQLLNTNADTIASMLAMALADNFEVDLVFCFDKSGVLTDVDDDTTVIPTINKEKYTGYKSLGVISAGMIPKLDNAFNAIERGVNSIRLCGTNALDESGKLLSGTVISEL